MALAKVQQWLDNGTSPIYMQCEMVTRQSWVQYDPMLGASSAAIHHVYGQLPRVHVQVRTYRLRTQGNSNAGS